MQLKTLIFYAQNRKDNYLEEIFLKFKFLIKKYARLLKYDDAESDLSLYFIELIDRMPTLKQDNAYVSYIQKSIKNRYLYLKRITDKYNYYEIPLEEFDYLVSEDRSNVDLLVCVDCVNKLPHKQKYIINKLFFEQYSEIEIARQLSITKQAVSKSKKKALYKLKDLLDD